MLIEAKDLQVGDEVLVGIYSQLRHLKILATPNGNRARYKVSHSNSYRLDKELNSEKHDKIKYLSLEYNDIWLIKREI